MLATLLLATSLAGLAAGLSCSCGVSPCQTPACCPSGRYTWDECGCCLVCAKAEGETCGGPFRVAGTCQEGSRCLRQCDCTTKAVSKCVFPFSYQGVSYTSCTQAGSENGAAWCAVQVDGTGEVVPNMWDDCQEGCPGTDFPCNEGFLFNKEGTCVNETDASTLLAQLRTGPLAFTLDDIPSNQREAPLCPLVRSLSGSPLAPTCSCTKATLN